MSLGRIGLIWLMQAAMVVSALPVMAQGETMAQGARDEEARMRFSAARMAIEDGRFEDALQDLNRAYELSGRPQLLFNIGWVAEQLRREREALEAFEAYLEQVPDAHNARYVEARVALLRERVEGDDSPEPAPAPTPSEAARATPMDAMDTSDERPAPIASERRGIAGRWWLWTVVGVVVAGGIVAGALLSRSSSSGDAFVGDDGRTHLARDLARW